MRAAAALLAAALLVGLAAGSCAKAGVDAPAQPAPQDPGWRIEGGRLALALSADATFMPIQGAEFFSEPYPEPKPFATQQALAAMAVQGKRLVLAVNRIGLRALTLRDRSDAKPGAEASISPRFADISELASAPGLFPSRSVGRFWPFGNTLRLFLYRHPYFETETAGGASHRFLELGSESSAEALEQASGLHTALSGPADIYAIYPQGQGQLLYQTREERGERVLSAYGRFDERAGMALPLSKQAFEAALQPAPLSAAPKELRELAALLSGDIVIELTQADGSARSYYRGSLAEATQAWAFLADEGALLAAADGRGAYLPAAGGDANARLAGAVGEAAHPRPFDAGVELGSPGLRYRDPLLFEGYAALIWEEELFPLLGRSGLLLVDCRYLGL
jgi:hypothetical protein